MLRFSLMLPALAMTITAFSQSSLPVRPLTVPSNEATREQLKLAASQGDAVDSCTSWIIHHANRYCGQLRAGEYKLTYAVGPPEGWYESSGGRTAWHPPSHANAHLWLFIQDGADNRLVPPLQVKLVCLDPYGKTRTAKSLPFAWMPLVNGYGDNLDLTGNGNYTFTLYISPPAWHRHDPYNGDRFTDTVTASFPLSLDLGQIAAQKPLSEIMETATSVAPAPGRAYSQTLKAMYKQANDGHDTIIGDYHIAFAVEYAEGYWDYEHGHFRYKVENDLSGATNAHVEVAVLDARCGRFLHDCMVTATLTKDRTMLGTKMEHFMWHPWLYHYGDNWRVPGKGTYTLKVHVAPPEYRQYGKATGPRFTSPVDVTFYPKIKVGEK